MEYEYHNYTIKAKQEEYHVDFEIYNNLDYLDDEPIATGSVKWDHCSNWDFSPDDVMMHFCEREEIGRFFETIQFCFDKTSELLDTWIEKL